jgi:hypothetical protein
MGSDVRTAMLFPTTRVFLLRVKKKVEQEMMNTEQEKYIQ